ncbi:Protein CHAPERONE-LIKE PROTEIN OF POR1-like [Trema orientale]|uniref:Protein CHAPERONE-LIKE PROTEIN OF POR1-like n=1 Tax=Trema orientale TaxID=63057 RepID=A0A2P5EWN9_TREOI|nr:Protein CHAPERONE-LIKE PROTEIN OF POR1-like [Trema orientale]
MAAATLSVRPNRISGGSPYNRPPARRTGPAYIRKLLTKNFELCSGAIAPSHGALARKPTRTLVRAGSRADDSAPFEMSVENALKLLGVSDGASFDDILRAKNSILATCKDDKDAVAQVEAAYDMLLMRSLTQRRAGKVVSSSIRYADVKPVNSPGTGSMPQWLQTSVKNSPVSVETPSRVELGLKAGVYGALMVLTYVNGSSITSGVPYAEADVPGLILAGSFGASLYFMTKKNVKLGKATIITIGGLVAGAVVGSAVENWLQVDIVPFIGLHSPAAVVTEFILLSQFLVSLYLR